MRESDEIGTQNKMAWRQRPVFVLSVVVAVAAVALVVLSVGIHVTASLRNDHGAGVTTALPPGDYVTFHCSGGSITLNGTTECNNQADSSIDLGGGTFYFNLAASAGTESFFQNYNATGDACLVSETLCEKSSTSSSVQLWGFCSTGSTCGGDVYVHFFQAQFLKGYADTPDGNGWGENLTFTVPSYASHILVIYAVSDTVAVTITAPAGLSTSNSVGTQDGMKYGALSAGSSYFNIQANGGWVNTATIAVYVISNDTNYTTSVSSVAAKTLTLSSGASIYLGTTTTGGTYKVNTTSLSTINEETTALNGGETGEIGSQSSDAFSLTSQAVTCDIVAIGFYPP